MKKATLLTATAISLISLSKNADAQAVDFGAQPLGSQIIFAAQTEHPLTSGCGCASCARQLNLSNGRLV